MRALRLSVLVALLVISSATAVPAAHAEVTDCSYTKSKKLVTLTISNSDTTGWLFIERSLGTNKIGYRAQGDSWRGCEGARTTTTNKIKVVGSSLSEDIYISVENGPFAPGASNEASGTSEIEFVLDLGKGTDTVTFYGSRGADRFAFTKPGQGKLNGDTDVDVTMSGVDRWRLDGRAGNDVLDGRGVPRVTAYGREGSDRLTGGDGPDSLYGDQGDSATGDGNDVINGGGGDDRLQGYRGSDTLNGGDGDDSLYGDEGNDSLKGGAGDDSLNSMSTKDGADRLDGGSGRDSAQYWSRTANLKLTLDGKANDGAKNEGDSLASNIERIDGGSGNDLLMGNNSPNDLNGNDGNDTLKGLGGDDDLSGGNGNDSVYGGAGDEYFSNDSGADLYDGGAGNDTVNAGSSADQPDVMRGGSGVDSVQYLSRVNAVSIDVTDGANDGEAGENDRVNDDFESIYGGSGSDTIRGSNSAETLNGGGGTGFDLLVGRGGADVLDGNDGNDTLDGGEGYDAFYGEGGDDTIDSFDNGEDWIDCGSGVSDTVTNRDDFDAVFNCELPV